jgi:hypothetical protein
MSSEYKGKSMLKVRRLHPFGQCKFAPGGSTRRIAPENLLRRRRQDYC